MTDVSETGPATTHLFLSHAGADTLAAREFAEILRRNGIGVWFDGDSLQPGERWMETLENAIQKASGMIVYVGQMGVQNWVDREVRLGLELNTREPNAFKLIPVLADAAEITSLPPFLRQHQAIAARDPEAIRRLLSVLRGADDRPAVPSEYWTTHTPFRSLQTFDPDDAWLFFGRDHETNDLIERLQRSRVLVVIGNSGSGKSSLIKAGLIPALQRGRLREDGAVVASWNVAVVRPGTDPFGELVESLARDLAQALSPADRDALITRWRETFPHAGDAVRNGLSALRVRGPRTLLFIDQFEELFTLAPEPVHRSYIEALLKTTESSGVHLIFGLRADFYGNALAHEPLKPYLQNNYSLSLMKSDQLREAIEKRLALAGARAEDGLTESLLADAGTEPGNLALLEHALAQLWEQNSKKYKTARLTNKRYDEIGRLKGAIGRHAQAVYSDLAPEQRPLVRRIFLQLVHLGDGAQDTRRRVPKQNLLTLDREGAVAPLLEYLASKRLIAASGENAEAKSAFVEVSHEAVIREWAEYRRWIDENRNDLRFGQRLATDAEDWQRTRARGALLQGTQLLKARKWVENYGTASAAVRDFVDASYRRRRSRQAVMIMAVIAAVVWGTQDTWLHVADVWAYRCINLARSISIDGRSFRDCSFCPEMVAVPGGITFIGSPEHEEGGLTGGVSEDEVTTAFAVSRFEVTFDEWDTCVAAGGCDHRPFDEGWGYGRQPVINVNFEDARKYVWWLTGLTRQQYGFLSDSEWEYAARWGEKVPDADEGNERNFLSTNPVGTFRPNGFGLYDMYGNVSEWVEGCWLRESSSSKLVEYVPDTTICLFNRIHRGGSWQSYRLAERWTGRSLDRSKEVGFRVKRAIVP